MADEKKCFVIMPITTPAPMVDKYHDGKGHFHHVYHCLFDPSIRTNALFNLHRGFLESFNKDTHAVPLGSVEEHHYGGVEEADNSTVFRFSPFETDVRQVAWYFGGMNHLRPTIDQLVQRVYLGAAA